MKNPMTRRDMLTGALADVATGITMAAVGVVGASEPTYAVPAAVSPSSGGWTTYCYGPGGPLLNAEDCDYAAAARPRPACADSPGADDSPPDAADRAPSDGSYFVL